MPLNIDSDVIETDKIKAFEDSNGTVILEDKVNDNQLKLNDDVTMADVASHLVASDNPHTTTLEQARSEDNQLSGAVNADGNDVTSVGALGAEEATIGATSPDSVRPSPLILRGGDSGQGIILQNKDDSQDTGAGRANITWYSDSEEYLTALTSHPSHNHFSIYTRNGPLGSSANLEKRMDIGGGSDLVTVKYKNLAEWRLNNGRLNVIDRMNPPVYATADDLPADADSQEADVAWVNDEERWYTYVA